MGGVLDPGRLAMYPVQILPSVGHGPVLALPPRRCAHELAAHSWADVSALERVQRPAAQLVAERARAPVGIVGVEGGLPAIGAAVAVGDVQAFAAGGGAFRERRMEQQAAQGPVPARARRVGQPARDQGADLGTRWRIVAPGRMLAHAVWGAAGSKRGPGQDKVICGRRYECPERRAVRRVSADLMP